jgi:hypothetical protein
MTASLFLGGKGPYTIDDLARDLDFGFLVLDMRDATELKIPECAIEGCTKFVYMTYQRTDNIGTFSPPQFACGVDHICPPDAVNGDFPLPECCLKGCDNEIATGGCYDHGGPKAACSKAHFLVHSGSVPPVRQRRSTKRAPSEPDVAQPTAATMASPLAHPSPLLSPVAHITRSRPVSDPPTPIDVAQMFDYQAVAEGGSADEVDHSAQQYEIGPHGYLQNSFLGARVLRELRTRLEWRATSRWPSSSRPRRVFSA